MADQRNKQGPFRFWFPYWNQTTPSPRPPAPTARRASPPSPSQAPTQPQITSSQTKPPSPPVTTRPQLSASPSSSSSSSSSSAQSSPSLSPSSSSSSPSRKTVKEPSPSPKGRPQPSPSPRRTSQPSKSSPTESPRQTPSSRISINTSTSQDPSKLKPTAAQDSSKAPSQVISTESPRQSRSPRIPVSESPSLSNPNVEATPDSAQVPYIPTPSTLQTESSKQPTQTHPLTSELIVKLEDSIHKKPDSSSQLLKQQPISQNQLGNKAKPAVLEEESVKYLQPITPPNSTMERTPTETLETQEKPSEEIADKVVTKFETIEDKQPAHLSKIGQSKLEKEPNHSAQSSYTQVTKMSPDHQSYKHGNVDTPKSESEEKKETESSRHEIPNKPTSSSNNIAGSQTEVKQSIQKPDQSKTSSTDVKARNYNNQEHKKGANGSEKPIPSSLPRASIGREERRTDFQEEIKKSISNLVQKLNLGHSQSLETEHSLSIITLAGQNTGASMNVGHKPLNKEGSTPVQQGHILHENHAAAKKGKNEANEKSLYHQSNTNSAISASVNSNVQSINNSLFHQSSCSQEDPGVHLTFYGKSPQNAELHERRKSLNTSEGTINKVPAAN